MNDKPIPMTMNIVVGVELDQTGELALERAMDLARATGARLHLCYCGGDVTGDPAQDERLLSLAEPRHLGRPHTYHYRRSIRMATAQPTIATTQAPLPS